ncbi:hypothetical protein HU200_042793 [Digitaria exilis]|uniref:Protein kinase domain-containing protein n=1 Tax=Digitaria exilis TaxID=1010633 RepID=A0A835B6V7_9POAL|nr:hypothetical protein HU200_042793 [Digitaria exilis]
MDLVILSAAPAAPSSHPVDDVATRRSLRRLPTMVTWARRPSPLDVTLPIIAAGDVGPGPGAQAPELEAGRGVESDPRGPLETVFFFPSEDTAVSGILSPRGASASFLLPHHHATHPARRFFIPLRPPTAPPRPPHMPLLLAAAAANQTSLTSSATRLAPPLPPVSIHLKFLLLGSPDREGRPPSYQSTALHLAGRRRKRRTGGGHGGGVRYLAPAAAMEARRGGGAASGWAAALWLWLLLLGTASLCGGAAGLNADGTLLMSFRAAITSDPTRRAVRPCDWNGVVCKGYPQPDTVNLTSSYDGGGGGGANSTAAAAWNGAAGHQRVAGGGDGLGAIEHLQHLDLAGNALAGALPATLLNATELRVLSLAGNHISGDLPDAAGAYARGLQELNLSGNALTGHLPASLCRLPSLAVLGLADNNLTGELPIGGLGVLELVDLSNNSFNGSFPSDFGGGHLRLLNISSNKLAGELPTELATVVPANATVDMSKNNFTGAIPEAGMFAAQSPEAYEGNPGLCGPPVKQTCSIPSSLSNPPNATDSPPAFAAIPKNPARASPGGAGEQQQAPHGEDNNKLSPAAIVAIVVGDIAGVGLLFMKKRRQRREEEDSPPPSMQQKSMRAIDGGLKKIRRRRRWVAARIGRRNDGSDSSEFSVSSDGESEDDEELKKRGSLIDRSTPQDHGSKKHNQAAAPAPATLVTVDGDGELEMETLLKASAYILGATGSSIVLQGCARRRHALAVRRIGESGGADKLKDFEAQVRAVARFRHPNILRRAASTGAPTRSSSSITTPPMAASPTSRRFGSSSPLHLSLESRLRIARGVARGLAYIHEKKANILLSADMEPWIGDLGLDRLPPARPSATALAHRRGCSMPGPGASPCGSASAVGAAATVIGGQPCLKNLRPTAKWDVYAFGMSLLGGGALPVARRLVVAEEHGRVLRMADPTLRGEADGREDALLACFRLAFSCCAMAPGKRPAMRDAVVVLERTAMAAPAGASAGSGAAILDGFAFLDYCSPSASGHRCPACTDATKMVAPAVPVHVCLRVLLRFRAPQCSFSYSFDWMIHGAVAIAVLDLEVDHHGRRAIPSSTVQRGRVGRGWQGFFCRPGLVARDLARG